VMKGQNTKGTISLYDLSLRKLARIIGNKSLRVVTPFDVEVFKSQCLQEARPTTASIYFRTLKTAFQKAVKFGIIKGNPFSQVRNVIIPQAEPVFLSRQDLIALIRSTNNLQLRAIITLAVCTSMRLGEIVNLRWDDNVDLVKGFIHLKNRDDFTLKARRRRSVPLNLTAIRILSEIERRSAFVFSDGKGQPLKAGYVSKCFKKQVRRAGLPESVHFHTLRHTGASLLVQQNVPIVYVQKILGHSSVRTTEIYTHNTVEHLQESVGRLDSLLGEDAPL